MLIETASFSVVDFLRHDPGRHPMWEALACTWRRGCFWGFYDEECARLCGRTHSCCLEPPLIGLPPGSGYSLVGCVPAEPASASPESVCATLVAAAFAMAAADKRALL